MRPASHMPLAEMMMAPPLMRLIALLSSTSSVMWKLGWRNSAASSSAMSSSVSAWRMKTLVTRLASGESRKTWRRWRNPFFRQQHADVVEEFLAAFDREARNDEIAAAFERFD